MKLCKQALLALFALLILTSCTSSNNGTPLPAVEIDDVSPRIVGVEPAIDDSVALPTNTSLTFRVSELLDESTIRENLTLYSIKSRNIYENGGSFDDSALLDSDKRDFSYSVLPYVYTETVTEVVREFVDEDDVVQTETRTIRREVEGLELTLTPEQRLALDARYVVRFTDGIRDLSPIETIDPSTGLPVQGNPFSNVSTEFFTGSGQWQSNTVVNTAFDRIGDAVTTPIYTTTDEFGLFSWLQRDSVLASRPNLYSRYYDQERQSFGASYRNDYIALAGDDVILEDAYTAQHHANSSNELSCNVWVSTDLSVTYQDVYLRCAGDEGNGTAFRVSSFVAGDTLEFLNVKPLSESQILVSVVANARLLVWVVDLDRSHNVTNSLSVTLSLDAHSVYEAPVFELSPDGQVLNVFTLSVVGSLNVIRHSILVSGTNWSLSRFHDLVSTSDQIRSLTAGTDLLSRGFVGYIQNDSLFDSFKVRRFDSVTWRDSVVVKSAAFGSIGRAVVAVHPEGQAMFVWSEESGVSRSVFAQGYFNLNPNAFTRTPIQQLSDEASSISDLSFLFDREGNGFVFYDIGSVLKGARFYQNQDWNEAFDDADRIRSGISSRNRQAGLIRSDGRIMLSYVFSNSSGYDELMSVVFSDFE